MTRLMLFSVLLGLAIGCGTETGNPEGLTVSYNSTSSDTARVSLTGEPGTVSVDGVWLRLGDVDFRDCEGETRQSIAGLGFADHGGPEAARQQTEVADVTYCAVETQFLPGTGPDEPVAVAGSSLALTGVLPDGRSWSISTDQVLPLTLTLNASEVPDAGSWLVTFDVAAWLAEVDLSALTEDPVVVDENTHPEVLQEVILALGAGIDVHEDVDDNGVIDPDDTRLGGGI